MTKMNVNCLLINEHTGTQLPLEWVTLDKLWSLAEASGWHDPAEDRSDDQDDAAVVPYSNREAWDLLIALERQRSEIAKVAGRDPARRSDAGDADEECRPQRYFAGSRRKIVEQVIAFLQKGAFRAVTVYGSDAKAAG